MFYENGLDPLRPTCAQNLTNIVKDLAGPECHNYQSQQQVAGHWLLLQGPNQYYEVGNQTRKCEKCHFQTDKPNDLFPALQRDMILMKLVENIVVLQSKQAHKLNE